MSDYFNDNNDFSFDEDFDNKRKNASRTHKSRDVRENLKKTLFGSYTKGSVENYVSEFKDSAENIRESLEFQIKEMRAEKELLSQENGLLKKQFVESEQRVLALQNEYIDIKDSGNELIKSLEKDKENLEKEKEQLNANLQSLEIEARSSISNSDENKQKLQNLESEVIKKNQELQNNAILLKEKEEEIVSLTNKTQIIKQNIVDSEIQLSIKEEEIEQVKICLEEKESQISELEKKLENSLDKLTIAKEKIESQREHINTLESSLGNSNILLDKANLEQLKSKVQSPILEEPEVNKLIQIELSNSKNEVERLKLQLENMENEVHSLLYKLNSLESKNLELNNEKKSYEELRSKFEKLYDNYKELGEENEKLLTDKEVLKDYLERNQIQEREFLLLNKNAEAYLAHIDSLEADLTQTLTQSEFQGKIIQDIMSKYEHDQNKVRKLIQEKTSLQTKNVDLLQEIRVLHRELIVKEDVSKFRKANEKLRYNKFAEDYNSLENQCSTPDSNKEVGQETDNNIEKDEISSVFSM